MKIAHHVLFSIVIVSLLRSAAAQCLDYVEGFRPTGVGGTVMAIAVFDAGNGPEIYAGGGFTTVHGEAVQGLLRLEGSEWRPISPAITGVCSALAVHDDGSGPALYIGGWGPLQIDGVPTGSNLVRWNGVSADVPGGGVSGQVSALEVFDGAGTGPMLYAGGGFAQAGGVPVGGIARWDGIQWSSLGGASPGVQNGTVNCLHAGVDSIGPALFVGGGFLAAGGVSAGRLARYDGAQWSAVSSTVINGLVNAVTTYSSPTGPRVVVGGSFDVPFTNARHVAEWNGSSWSDMAGGMWSTVQFPLSFVSALGVMDSGNGPRVYATGTFHTAGGSPAAKIAVWNGSAWSALGSGLVGSTWNQLTTGNALETVDLGAGPRLVVGGNFARAGSALGNGIASFDGTRFHTLDKGNGVARDDLVSVMTSFDDGSGEALWMGGTELGAGTVGQHQGVVRFDGQTWRGFLPGMYVATFAAFDDGGGEKLYVGANGGGTECVMRWNGAAWEPLPGGPLPVQACRSLCAFDDGNGAALYMGTHVAPHLYRWKNNAWSPIPGGPNGAVTYMVVFDDGNGADLYVGGSFWAVGGAPIESVARFDGASWSGVGFDRAQEWQSGLNVEAMVAHDDGNGPKLYVGGGFEGGLARFDGSTWLDFALGATEVMAFATFDEGQGRRAALYMATGSDPLPNPTPKRLLRWDGSAITEVGSAFFGGDPATEALAVLDDGTTRSLYVGGRFQRAGVRVSQGIARMDACGQTGELFCFGDGSSAACPCGNASRPRERAGCTNSFGMGGALRASGRASLSGDTASLDGSAMTNAAVLYVQGAHESSGVPFGDGIKCTTGPFVRLGTRLNASGASSFPGGVGPSLSVRGLVVAPGSRYYQARYRNASAFCTSDTFNYTNGVALVWGL